MTLDPWAKKKSLYSSPVSKITSTPRTKWRVLPSLWKFIKRTCTVVGAGVLIFSFISAWSLSSLVEPSVVGLPDQMVLYMELDGNLSDLPAEVNILDPFAPPPMTLRNFVDALDAAKDDKRVKGLYARLNAGGYAVAQIQEMREAIQKFRKSGKFAYIYSSSFAETGGLGSYYLASAFDEIWMQPMGSLSIAGINAEMPFMRNVLDKIGIEPQFFQRKEYKSAYENLTHSSMTPANREMMEILINDIASTIQKDVAQDIGVTESQFRALVDQALFTAPEALKSKLIDHADYADVLVSTINEKVTGDKASEDLPYINFVDYVSATNGGDQGLAGALGIDTKGPEVRQGSTARVALVYAVGAITSSRETSISAPMGLMDTGVAAADEIAGALIEASDDPTIDAIVLRVDSPGGSPVASETILRAVEKAKEKGKTVTVSMGATAASGGYWISAYADRIFVLPSTLTGSIGVLGGKVSAKELWKKLDINWEGVKWGENSGMWSMNTPFSEKEAERMNAMLDDVYVNFISRVAKGRKLKESDVEAIARGRVWTGGQAIDLKLADQIGGLNAALDYAAVKAGGKDRHDVDIVVLPKPLTAVEEFVQIFGGQVRAGQILNTLGQMMIDMKPYWGQIAVMNEAQGINVYEPVKIR